MSQNATVCQSKSRCKNPLNLVTMCQGSSATRCLFRDQSKCLSNPAIRCLLRSVSKFQSKSRSRFLQKFQRRFVRTVMDTAEAMAALQVLMALADLLVDSTEVNLADLAV